MTQIHLTRRTALAAAAALAAVGLVPQGLPLAHATPGGKLKGLGLTRAEFAALATGSVPGQGATIYDIGGEKYYVNGDTSTAATDRVVSVYWGSGSAAAGPPEADVRTRLAQFLPEDAVLTQRGDAPGAGIGPRLRVDVYNSPSLGSVLQGSGFVDSGDLLVAYVYTGRLDGTVSWANAYVAAKP